MAAEQKRVVCVAIGSRGDVQPLCVLAQELSRSGVSVTFIANDDYRGLVGLFGLDPVTTDVALGEIFRGPEFERALSASSSPPLRLIPSLLRHVRRIEADITHLVQVCAREIRGADLVLYTPLGFFAGLIAREFGIQSIQVCYQPLFPSWRRAAALHGGRDLGPVLNRLSYETSRGFAFLVRRALRAAHSGTARVPPLGRIANPITLSGRISRQLLAFSPTLAPDSGAVPPGSMATGFWFRQPAPGETLPDAVSAFLAAGPPPVAIGFGSMLWGAPRNTPLVLEAVRQWGGRAILCAGAGGLHQDIDAGSNVLVVRSVSHPLLFPHVAGVVHHGGAGTTAEALRSGAPSIVLPVVADQLFWGRRVEAVGAGPAPIPRRRVTPQQLAALLAAIQRDPAYRAAAGRMARLLASEPGVAGAAEIVRAALQHRDGVDQPAANRLRLLPAWMRSRRQGVTSMPLPPR